jgi:uncharacterized protein YdeI (YjbR/CyaY-like superfamily)
MAGPALPIRAFASAAAWETWLKRHHRTSPGLWLRFYKKASGRRTVRYAEALDVALCHGWIDGQLAKGDALSYLHRFTPRRPRSGWSRRNTEHVARLTAAGRMGPAGLAHVAAAQADGRWAAAYDSPRHAAPPPDFLQALAPNRKARDFFATLDRRNVYAIVYRLQTAKKAETRARRIQAIVAMLAEARAFHPG